MSRRVLGVAVVGMLGAMLAGLPVQASAGGEAIPMHSSSVERAGIVDVASLPLAGGQIAGTTTLQEFPLGKRPGDSPVSSSPRTAVAGAQAPLVTISAGPNLTPALKNDDNEIKLTPPDMGVGADKTHVVEMVNAVGRIWTKSVAGPAFQLKTFFMAGSNFIGDPWVIYDQESKRWFAGIFDVTLGGERIAVSKTGNPTASWFVYSIQYPGVTGGGCPDQGKGGVDHDVVALGFNEFAGNGCTGGYLGAAIEVFNKAEMIAGASLDFTFTKPQPSYFSLVPAQALTNGQTTEYFASNDFSSTSRALHRLTSTGVPGVGPVTLTPLGDLTLSSTYPSPPNATQPGTASLLATGDSRMQHVVWKGGVGLLMSWSQACKPAGDTVTRACARVIATNDGVSGPAVIMDETLSKTGQYYVYPAATLNASNDVVVAFGVTSATVFPQLDAAAATVGGTFGAALALVKGTSANTTGRYGDYFAVALDPSGAAPNQRVWAAGEIGGPIINDWSTAIRKVKVTP